MNILALDKEIKKSQERLAVLQSDKIKLEADILVAESHLSGLQTALKIIGKPAASLKSQELRPDSEIARVRDILLNSPAPMHIDDILKILGDVSKAKKGSLVGSINSYIKTNRIFAKVAPNTFTVIKTKQEANEME